MSTLPSNSIFNLPASEWNPTLAAFNKNGITLDHLDRLRFNNGNNTYAQRIGRAFAQDGFESSTETRIARVLLGRSFIELARWTSMYNKHFSAKQMRASLKFPWHEDVLMSPDPWEPTMLVKDTHTAFFGVQFIGDYPLTVKRWIEMHPQAFRSKQFDRLQSCIGLTTLEERWYLMRTNVILESTVRRPEEQAWVLPFEYEIPTVIAEVAKNILVFSNQCPDESSYPNPDHWARCMGEMTRTDGSMVTDLPIVGSTRDRVPGSHFALDVDRWVGLGLSSVGIGASRKIPAT